MTRPDHAAHVLSHQYPELTRDDVSRYVTYLKEKYGPAKSAGVYSIACRAAPVGENPLGLQRGSVVTIEGERYVALGCGFMTLEFASLDRPNHVRSVGADDFVRLSKGEFHVLGSDESRDALNAIVGPDRD
jgi:hypothetical protein